MLDKIKEIIENNPKNYSRMIQKNTEMMDFINSSSLISSELSFIEKLFIVLHPDISPFCENGKRKKINRFSEGYKFCQAHCKCATQSRLENMKKTNLERFGVENANQNVEIKNKRKITNIKRYGSSSPLHSDIIKSQIKENLHNTYGVQHHMQLDHVKAKLKATNLVRYGKENRLHAHNTQHLSIESENILNDKNKFNSFIQGKTAKEIAKELGCHYSTIHAKSKQYNIDLSVNKPYWENELANILTVNNIDFIRNTRKIISPLELDFYFPDQKIAIKLNGCYWHCELNNPDTQYHYKKFVKCKEKGIQLIQIFDDEWDDNKESVIHYLLHILGANPKYLGARKCKVEIANYKEVEGFYNKYHHFGYTVASTHLVLKYDNQIVAAMSFLKGKLNSWNLVRFCVGTIRVQGAASKLLNYFKNNYIWDEIKTFADLRWSSGSLYRILGFTEEEFIPPTYFYLDLSLSMSHRFNHRKRFYKEQYDVNNLTESEITAREGLTRIWDAGKIKFTLKK